jgi:hypothetical protein
VFHSLPFQVKEAIVSGPIKIFEQQKITFLADIAYPSTNKYHSLVFTHPKRFKFPQILTSRCLILTKCLTTIDIPTCTPTLEEQQTNREM